MLSALNIQAKQFNVKRPLSEVITIHYYHYCYIFVRAR